MAKFEVGEIAVGHNFKISTHLNGEDLLIVGGYYSYKCDSLNGVPCTPYLLTGYKVKHPDGGTSVVKESNLRKKHPPQELSSWENIQEITGWNPTKENQNV